MTSKYPMVIAPATVALPVEFLNAPVQSAEIPVSGISNASIPNATNTHALIQSVTATNASTPESLGADEIAQIACNGQTEMSSPNGHLEITNLVINKIAAQCEQYMHSSVVVDTGTSFDQVQFDSLSMLEILYELEEELDITLDPSTLPVMTRVGDLVAAVNRARKLVP